MSQRILHVTDFHINDPRNADEHLSSGAAPEYLKSLANAVYNEAGGQLDGIVATGDFVDKGKVGNFPYAHKILERLAGVMHVPVTSIGVCIGNHDFDRKLDESGDSIGARSAYSAFISAFANGNPIEKSERAVLFSVATETFYLMLDATLGCLGKDIPGTLTPSEIDEIMAWVQAKVPPAALLVIGSHYPVFETPDSLLSVADSEPRYQERHLWNSAKLLRHRLAEWRQVEGQTVWLCGDIHASDQFMSRDVLTLATGRLGTRIGGSAARKQARVIQFDGARTIPKLWTLNYEPPGHTEKAHYGSWTAVETTIRIVTPPGRRAALGTSEVLVPAGPTTVGAPPAADVTLDPSRCPPPSPAFRASATCTSAAPLGTIEAPPISVDTIEPALERKIMEVIAAESLYTLGRFDTSESVVSLSWVSIGPLLETAGVLTGMIDAMADWLRTQFGHPFSAAMESVLLVGIDCWGAVLASQLSVLTGANNYCIASRGGGRHHTASEIVNEDAVSAARASSTIVLVTDVISTGQSLNAVCESITKGLGADTTKKRWFALSILCDNHRDLAFCQFLHAHATACGQLRMPVLSKNQLPSEDVLPATLSFISG